MNGDIYKSDTIVVQTDEGGKYINSQRFHLSSLDTIKLLLKALRILLEVMLIGFWMYPRLTVPL